MAIDDPKRYMDVPKEAPVKQSEFLVAMQLLLDTIKTSADPEAKERVALEAERLLLERERLTRDMPENKQDPGVSVYSYPEGDLKHPKPDLRCKMFWVGYPMEKETLTPLEVELLNKLQPGDYWVTKTDGARIRFTVAPKVNNKGDLEELNISFQCKGEDKHNHGSMASYLQQALGNTIPSTEELMAELARLQAELAVARVGVGAS